MALARSIAIVHNQWMMDPHLYQAKLLAAMIDATTSIDAPPFMCADKEALSLLMLMRQVASLLRTGHCPLVKLMALSQQALRCGAVGCAQEDSVDATVESLLAKTVPGAN